MATTERAAAIRAALKANGWTSRQVSVRARSFSGGSSIDVAIKDGAVPLAAVKAIAEPHERIDRCQLTGDILAGCNRYVWVGYTDAALAEIAAPYLPAVTDALAALRGLPQSHHANIGQTGCTVGADGSGYGVALWGRDRRLGQFEQTDARGIAARVGLEVQ